MYRTVTNEGNMPALRRDVLVCMRALPLAAPAFVLSANDGRGGKSDEKNCDPNLPESHRLLHGDRLPNRILQQVGRIPAVSGGGAGTGGILPLQRL